MDIYTPFEIKEYPWHPQDRLLLKSFAAGSTAQSTTTVLKEDVILKAFSEGSKKRPQEHVESIFSMQKSAQKNRVIDRALLIMLILRNR